MSIFMTRNALEPGDNNIDNPQANQFRFYEATYTTTGAKDWIYLPDAEECGVQLGLVAAGTGTVEFTCSAKPTIEAGNAITTKWAPGDVTASAFSAVSGVTAVRANLTSGQWKIAVRC